MKCTIKLYSVLRIQMGIDKVGLELNFDESISIDEMIDQLQICPKDVSMIIVNGELEANPSRVVNDGDVIQMFPALPSGG